MCNIFSSGWKWLHQCSWAPSRHDQPGREVDRRGSRWDDPRGRYWWRRSGQLWRWAAVAHFVIHSVKFFFFILIFWKVVLCDQNEIKQPFIWIVFNSEVRGCSFALLFKSIFNYRKCFHSLHLHWMFNTSVLECDGVMKCCDSTWVIYLKILVPDN